MAFWNKKKQKTPKEEEKKPKEKVVTIKPLEEEIKNSEEEHKPLDNKYNIRVNIWEKYIERSPQCPLLKYRILTENGIPTNHYQLGEIEEVLPLCCGDSGSWCEYLEKLEDNSILENKNTTPLRPLSTRAKCNFKDLSKKTE